MPSLGCTNERLISTCLQNVDDVRDICEYLSTTDAEALEDMRSTFTALALLSAASVHLWSKHAAGRLESSNPSSEHNQIHIIFDLLQSWAFQWKMARACSDTLQIICLLYKHAYHVDVDLSPASGPLLVELSTGSDDDEGPSPQYRSRGGDGYPDVASMHQRLYDKIRMVTLSPLQSPETKRSIMKIFLSTMWEHAWVQEGLPMIEAVFQETSHGPVLYSQEIEDLLEM